MYNVVNKDLVNEGSKCFQSNLDLDANDSFNLKELLSLKTFWGKRKNKKKKLLKRLPIFLLSLKKNLLFVSFSFLFSNLIHSYIKCLNETLLQRPLLNYVGCFLIYLVYFICILFLWSFFVLLCFWSFTFHSIGSENTYKNFYPEFTLGHENKLKKVLNQIN